MKVCCCFLTMRDQSKISRLFQLILMYIKIGLIIFVYYIFSIGLTFYQKNLFKEFPFPLTVVMVHLMMKFLFSGIWRVSSNAFSPNNSHNSLPWRLYFSRVFPAGAAAGIDIGLSQWSLEFITVTLYTMTKSTALLFILLFAILFKLEEMEWSIVVLVSLITGGLLMFTYKYTQFDIFGFSLVMTASFLSGLRWSLSQLLMQKEEMQLSHPVDLVYHIQPWMAVSLLPLAIGFEGTSLAGSAVGFNYTDSNNMLRLWSKVLFGALIAFCMEMSEYYVVRTTSSLTFSVAGVAKEVATLSLAIYFYNEHLSIINQLGLGLCVLGISLHVYLKGRRSRNRSESHAHSECQYRNIPNTPEEAL